MNLIVVGANVEDADEASAGLRVAVQVVFRPYCPWVYHPCQVTLVRQEFLNGAPCGGKPRGSRVWRERVLELHDRFAAFILLFHEPHKKKILKRQFPSIFTLESLSTDV